MYNINNRKTIGKLVRGSLKEYKMRNLFVLVTIVLSVSLLSGFAFLGVASMEADRKEMTKRQHVIYQNVDEEQMKAIAENQEVTSSKELKRGKSFEVEDYILSPYYLQDNKSPMQNLNVVEGRYPKEINEVMVSDQMLIRMGLKPEAGELISVTYLDKSKEEYVVSGVIAGEKADVYMLYMSREYALKGSQLKDIPFELAVQITDAPQMEKEEFLSLVQAIGEKAGVKRGDVNENNHFVRSLSVESSNLFIIFLTGAAILFVSVMVIYSIFYISISERTRQFGQLKTIGMTEKQIKKMVRKEGTFFSLLGSSIGIAIGAGFVIVIKPEGFILGEFCVYGLGILVANYVTVQLSIAAPAKTAASISPIEAAKVSGYEKEAQTSVLCRKLTPINLSMIAARGNRKKSFMTIVSLCLAGTVLMCAGSLVSSIEEERFSRQNGFEYCDYIVGISINASQVNEYDEMGIKVNNPLEESLITDISSIDHVKEVTTIKNIQLKYTYKDVTLGQDLAAPFSRDQAKQMEQFLNDGKIDYEEMVKNKEIVIARNDLAKEILGFKFEVGDTVKLEWFNGEKIVEDTFTIGEILKRNSAFDDSKEISRLVSSTGWFLIPEDMIEGMMVPGFNLNTELHISCDDYVDNGAAVEEEIRFLAEKNPLLRMSSLSDSIDHNKQQYKMLYITFMGVALFVIMFSIINLLNTLISNTMARKREYASLGAIGADGKQIRTMIMGEGLYFAAVNLIATVVFGSFFGYLTVRFTKWNGLSYLEYQYPWVYLLGYAVFVMAVTGGISVMITGIMGKKSLIDRLREAE